MTTNDARDAAAPPNTVLTVAEVAAELRIGRNAAYELVKNGEIFSRRIGRSIRIPRTALERYLAGEPQVRGLNDEEENGR